MDLEMHKSEFVFICYSILLQPWNLILALMLSDSELSSSSSAPIQLGEQKNTTTSAAV